MALVGQGGGDGPQVGDVVRVERTGAPGVVAGGCQSGQEAAARGEAQRVLGGGAPGGRGGVGGGIAAGPYEEGQRGVEREGQRGGGPAAHA